MSDSGCLVRTGILQGFEAECRARGVDAAELLAELGLPGQILEQPDLYIRRTKSVALLSLGAERTGCPSFGLELAERQDHRVMGALSHLIFRGTTIRDSLELARQYMSYHIRGATLSFRSLDAEWSVVEVGLGLEVRPETRPSTDLSLVHIARILWRLGGESFAPKEVWMTHPEPADVTPYRRLFHAPIIWEQPTIGVVIPTDALDRAPSSVPDIKEFLLQYVETISAPLEPSNLGAQIRAVLRSLIGRSSASAEVVGAAVGMHVRELQRELKSHGLSFSKLRDEVQREYACSELQRPDTKILTLALALGYSDASAFSRAFKRWTGESPTAWRRRSLQGTR